MSAKTIAIAIAGMLVAVSLSACSGSNDAKDETPIKYTAAECIGLSVGMISKRNVLLTAKASWAKKDAKSSPIRGYYFQLVDLKRDREPYHFLVPTSKRKATFTFDDVRPGKYSARVILHTSAGAQADNKNCAVDIRVR